LTPEKFLHRQWIIDGRGALPPGYHIYGPFAKSDDTDHYGMHYQVYWTNLYPRTTNYPRMRTYVASEWMAGMNEFTVQETIVPSYCSFAYLDSVDRTPAAPAAHAPGILVLAPARGGAVADETSEVRVRVAATRGVAAVRLNGVAASGTLFYSSTVTLHEGTNSLCAIAIDMHGLAATTQWEVVCTVPEPALLTVPAVLLATAQLRRAIQAA
jgi:hypothetical protein